MKEYMLRKIGGPEYRKSERCEICKRSFKKIPFGHQLITSWGSIDVCELCVEDLYMGIMADLGGGIFSLKRDIERVTSFLDKLANSKTWKQILSEAGLIRSPQFYPKNIQKEFDKLSKRYDIYIKKWGKKVRPLRKKLRKLDSQQERFKAEVIKKRIKLLRKASADAATGKHGYQ